MISLNVLLLVGASSSYHVEVFHFATIRPEICEVEVPGEQNLQFLISANKSHPKIYWYCCSINIHLDGALKQENIHREFWKKDTKYLTSTNFPAETIFMKFWGKLKLMSSNLPSVTKHLSQHLLLRLKEKPKKSCQCLGKRWANLSCDCPWPTTRYPFWYPSPLSKAAINDTNTIILADAHHI